jgi:hypothetical protein
MKRKRQGPPFLPPSGLPLFSEDTWLVREGGRRRKQITLEAFDRYWEGKIVSDCQTYGNCMQESIFLKIMVAFFASV